MTRSLAPFLVMRLSPPRGFFGGRLGLYVSGRFDTGVAALQGAVEARSAARAASPYGGAWRRRASFWVEARGQRAHRGWR